MLGQAVFVLLQLTSRRHESAHRIAGHDGAPEHSISQA
jgi:hypothetical protein